MRPVIIEWQGEKDSITGWAKRLRINKGCLHRRLKNWPLERAMTKPKKRQARIVVKVEDPEDLERARKERKSIYDRNRYLRKTCSTAKPFSV